MFTCTVVFNYQMDGMPDTNVSHLSWQ